LRKSHDAEKSLFGSFILCRHPAGEILSPSLPNKFIDLHSVIYCVRAPRGSTFEEENMGLWNCVTRELIKGGKTNTIFLTFNKGGVKIVFLRVSWI
jgi:hypothetical protein